MSTCGAKTKYTKSYQILIEATVPPTHKVPVLKDIQVLQVTNVTKNATLPRILSSRRRNIINPGSCAIPLPSASLDHLEHFPPPGLNPPWSWALSRDGIKEHMRLYVMHVAITPTCRYIQISVSLSLSPPPSIEAHRVIYLFLYRSGVSEWEWRSTFNDNQANN